MIVGRRLTPMEVTVLDWASNRTLHLLTCDKHPTERRW